MQPLRVLLIGGGAIAGGYDAHRADSAWPRTHAAAYRRAGGFELVAVVEPDDSRRQAFQDRWSVPHGFATLDKASTVGPFDVISVCSPTASHAADLAAAIALRPRLIFCEKPVTPTLAESRSVVAAAKAAGIALVVNHTRRWAPDMIALKDALSAGDHGRVRSVQGLYTKGILNNGSHMFDTLGLLFGDLHLLSVGRAVADHAQSDPSIPFLAETASGISIGVGIGDARDYAVFELSILAERGLIRIEDGGGRWRTRQVVDSPEFRGYRTLDQGIVRSGRYDEAMTAAVTEIRNWADCGSPLSSTGETALLAQTLSETALRLSRAAPPPPGVQGSLP